jgi:CCR4-NOT transcriptional complex subunit CAF120
MVGMAYSTPSQMHPMYQQQQQQYFPQTPTPQMNIPGGWISPAQTPQGQYFPQSSPQGYGNMAQQQQQQNPPTQAYGASFDQAQQAAKFAQQQAQGQYRR